MVDLTGLAAFGSGIPGGYQRGQLTQQEILARQLQNREAQDLRAASLASLLDNQGMDPTTSTIMALSGMGQQQPTQMQGAPPPPMAPQAPQPQIPIGGAPPSAGDMPAGPGGAPLPQPMAPQGAPQGGGIVTPTSAPRPAAGGLPPFAPGMAPFQGGQMSLGQMLARLKSDPRNKGIPDTTLLGIAGKYQQILNPADRMLLTYMTAQQRNATTERGQDMTAMWHDTMATIAGMKAEQPNNTMVPGMGPPGPDGKPTFGIYVMDKKGGTPQFVPTQGAVGAGAVTQAVKGGTFTPEMGALMGALAEKGVSLPTGFRSKEQQASLYQALIDRNPGKTPDQIADMVKEGKVNLAALTKEVTTAAGQAGKIQVAANEIKKYTPIILDASAKVPRGNFVPLNRLLQAGEASISDPNLKKLKSYITTVLNAYDALGARGGTDVEKRAENRRNLLAADGPEAMKAALEAMDVEAGIALESAREATKVPTESTNPAPTPQQQPAQNDPLGIR